MSRTPPSPHHLSDLREVPSSSPEPPTVRLTAPSRTQATREAAPLSQGLDDDDPAPTTLRSYVHPGIAEPVSRPIVVEEAPSGRSPVVGAVRGRSAAA